MLSSLIQEALTLPLKIKVGKCLLQRRLDEAGMIQQDLADKTGIDKTHISKFAHGERNMSLAYAKVISDSLGCSIEDLYEWVSVSAVEVEDK
jgi:putative transcriptional regulator